MVKVIIVLFVILSSPFVLGKDTLNLQFNNGQVEFNVNIEESEGSDGFYVNDISVQVPTEPHGSLHLVAEFGYGDSSYDFLCKQISLIKFGTEIYQYASAYGYATQLSIFSGILSKTHFFVVNQDQTFSISDSYPNSVYDSGFSCFEERLIY